MLDYNSILYIRRTNDTMYYRLKDSKTEIELPFETVLSYDKNIEFVEHCERLENNNNLNSETGLWKYIKSDTNNRAEKVYYTKYDKVYSNGTICIYKTKISNYWIVWNRNKSYNTGSCVVKSKNYPGHIPAILEVKRIPDQAGNKNLLSALIILTTDESYKKRLNKVWYKIFNE